MGTPEAKDHHRNQVRGDVEQGNCIKGVDVRSEIQHHHILDWDTKTMRNTFRKKVEDLCDCHPVANNEGIVQGGIETNLDQSRVHGLRWDTLRWCNDPGK